jgi:hypothetical protein
MDDELLPTASCPLSSRLVVRNFHGEDINWPLGGPHSLPEIVVVRQSALADIFILDWI